MNAETTVQIRRYPNRRLYDRSRRRYVTLQDIEDLVLGGKTVEVQDSRSGEDLTRQILTQILMERYPQKMDMFPIAMLHSILRSNDLAMELWRGYLFQSLAAMESWQKAATPFTRPLDWMSNFFPNLKLSPAEADNAQNAVAQRLDALAERIARLEIETEQDGEATLPGITDPLDHLERRVNMLENTPLPTPRRRTAGG